MKLKHAQDNKDYATAKKYVINMYGGKRTLHIKKNCFHSGFLIDYYDFDSREEVDQSGVSYKECKLCFPPEK